MGTEITIRIPDLTFQDLKRTYGSKSFKKQARNILVQSYYDRRTVNDYVLSIKKEFKSTLSDEKFKELFINSVYELSEYMLNNKAGQYKDEVIEDVFKCIQ